LKEGSRLRPYLQTWLEAAAWIRAQVGREEGLAVLREGGREGGVLDSRVGAWEAWAEGGGEGGRGGGGDQRGKGTEERGRGDEDRRGPPGRAAA